MLNQWQRRLLLYPLCLSRVRPCFPDATSESYFVHALRATARSAKRNKREHIKHEENANPNPNSNYHTSDTKTMTEECVSFEVTRGDDLVGESLGFLAGESLCFLMRESVEERCGGGLTNSKAGRGAGQHEVLHGCGMPRS